MKLVFAMIFFAAIASCSSEQAIQESRLYYPAIGSGSWETKSTESLGWNQDAVQPLLDYLQQKNTKSFMVLYDGRIVLENYFDGHSQSSNWYWASAGKTLTATMTGIAAQDGLLNLEDKVSDYLGTGWTAMPSAKENLVKIRNLLEMTSGIDDSGGDCVAPECLTYNSDAGTRWAYHNVYVKLQDVVAVASGTSYEDYFNQKLRDKIGMNGGWFVTGDNVVYTSTTRSAARFGLLMLRKGKWLDERILNEAFFDQATNTSQTINEAYGYLWWLNGKNSYHLPQTQFEFQGSLIPSAPVDMFMALGKNDQKIYVVPSRKLVIVRFGNAADSSNAALSDFDDQLWQKVLAVID